MNALMFIIVALIALTALTALVAAGKQARSLRRLRSGPVFEGLKDAAGFSRLLALPLVTWALLFLLVLVVLLVVSGVALLYVFALFHGEWFQLLDNAPRTAGNVVVHLVYPLQMALFSFVTFLLAVGGFQLVFGPVEALRRVRLRVDGVGPFTARVAGVLAIVAALEVVKTLVYSLLVAPEDLRSFFARDTLPKADPLGLALVGAAVLVAVAAWWRGNSGAAK